MLEILLDYKRPDPTTWVYMSAGLIVGLFFVFRRFWSIRNLDIALLISLAPGLLVYHEGRRRELQQDKSIVTEQDDQNPGLSVQTRAAPERSTAIDALVSTMEISDDQASSEAGEAADSAVGPKQVSPKEIQRWGFIYLFVVEGLILVRLIIDPLMVRRPLLDPNLTAGGLLFLGISLFFFMMANVVTSNPLTQANQGQSLGPGYTMMNRLPAIPTRPAFAPPGIAVPPTPDELTESQKRRAQIAKALAIFAHLAIVSGMVFIGNRHFGNLFAGVGCAMLYLMLPYTAQFTGRVDHFLPAALLLWAVLCYRKPMVAGIFLGLAGGLVYYPLFLLPLWFSFYWRRGARSFGVGVVAMLALLMMALSFDDSASLTEHLRRMYGLFEPNRDANQLGGLWGLGWYPIWRLPVIVAFVILSAFFAIWPAQKSLATLISGSAALMVGAQFWHGYGGGLYIGWFLPLLLLVIFRPNLQDRVATKVVAIRGRAQATVRPSESSLTEPEPA